jgi:hypothetical protein
LFHIFPKYGKAESFEAFKYGQSAAAKAWLALAAILGTLVAFIYK